MMSHADRVGILRKVHLQKQPHDTQRSQGSSCFQQWFLNAHVPSHRIVANLVCDSLDEIAYSASLAGLQYSLNYHSEGLSVCVYGYQDKLPLLLRVVLEKINNLRPQVDRLEVFKEKVRLSVPAKWPELTMEVSQAIRDYGNFPLQKPADHAGYYARYLVHTMQWTPEEKLPEVAGTGWKQTRERFLIYRRYRRGGCTSTPRKPFVSIVRGDACYREFYGQGRRPFVPRLKPYAPTRKQLLSRRSSKNSYNTKYSRRLRFLSQKHWSFPWVRTPSYFKRRIQ